MDKTNKRGQFFIIAALIGVLVIFSFIGLVTYKELTKTKKFYNLGKNFKFEVAEIIAKGKLKSLQETQVNIQDYLDNITHEYLKYGLTEDPNLEIIYVYGNQSSITVYNFANEEACVYVNDGCERIEGGRKNISSTLSLGEIKTTVINEVEDYRNALDYIRKAFSFSQSQTKITIEIGGINYSFDLSENEQFYLILRTRKGNETLIARE